MSDNFFTISKFNWILKILVVWKSGHLGMVMA